MKFIHNLFTLFLLTTTCTTMTAMSKSSTDILKNQNKSNHKSISFKKTYTIFHDDEIEIAYKKDDEFFQALTENTENIKAMMKENACKYLVEKYTQKEDEEYTQQDIDNAIALYEAEREVNKTYRFNLLKKSNAEIAQKDSFYDAAATHLLRASLIVGGLYLASSYFQKKK